MSQRDSRHFLSSTERDPMNAKDAIKHSLKSTQNMLEMYLSDLSDADLLVRPVPGANHIAWQLGHLINSEKKLIKEHFPAAAYPELPAALTEKDTKEASSQDSPAGYRPKGEYLEFFNQVRSTTLIAL